MDTTFEAGLGGGRKATIVGIIVAMHVLLIWALLTSLGVIVVDRPPPIIKAEIIEEVQDKDEPPPPPPTIETPPPYVPPPDILIEAPVDAPKSNTALVAVDKKPVAAPPPVASGVKKAPEIDPKYKRRFQPDYPPTSRRLGEEGSVVLQVLVGVDGEVKDGKVQTSSGFERLDDAALKHALRAWRFTPGTEDGVPVQTWHSVKVTFKIEG